MQRPGLNSVGDYLAIARRRRRLLLTFCPGVLLLAVLLAFKLPAVYRASGTIMLEASSVPEELVRSTVASYADQQIELLRRRVLTVDRLSELVAQVDPYPQLTQLSARDKAWLIADNTEIERVDPVTLEPLLESTAFSIHYHNPSPEFAATIASAIIELFLTHNTERRTESATETYAFLIEQAKRLEEAIAAAASALADFKEEHAGTLPDSQNMNQGLSDRAERDLVDYDRRIREADQQRQQLQVQLSQTPPSLMVAAGDWRTQIATMQAQLAEARQKYTEEHPDIRRLERSIENLRATAAANGRASTPDNPVYLQLQQQVRGLDRELAALRGERAAVRAQVDEYVRRLNVAPDIERQYIALTGDYEIAQNEYREIKQKISEAEIARSLESEQRGERFTEIRAPSAPSRPHSPNRLGIILLGFVLAVGGGIGIAALAEMSDSTIRGARDLRDIVETPPIGAVPFIYNAGDRRRRHVRWAMAIGAFAAVALIGGML